MTLVLIVLISGRSLALIVLTVITTSVDCTGTATLVGLLIEKGLFYTNAAIRTNSDREAVPVNLKMHGSLKRPLGVG
jgi:hypothetical protein